MGEKAKRNHTSEQPSLDDDVHWMPLVEAVAMLTKRMTSKRFAIPVIEKAMESGKLPYMRCLTTGERETPPPGFMAEHCIHYSDEGHVTVYRGDKNDPRRWDLLFPHPEDDPPDHVYFVSQSDFEHLRTVPQQQQAEPQPNSDKPKGRDWQMVRLKTVLPIVYPDGVPANATDLAVQQKVASEYNKLSWKLVSDDTIGRFRRPKPK